ncbi:hypothetical protein H8S11_02295 [Flintibacter sp. NSJ-23]|uniref:WD40 repeat domain-containing protein n=1 Tax=Flintibacter hominis TaxID=2763048 RepID=A0A8J6M2F0_9FIRM|nr:DUF5711 family protein [Flintibacter hominis]MBC5721655.1 hypothetical protein [Flintibacter hominis]
MEGKQPAKKAKKPNILFRLLALLVTAALVLGALALVVYRDRFNLDAVKRWLAYRSIQTSDTGEAVPFTHAGGDKMSLAYLENGILMSSAAGAHYYSFSGRQYAEEVLSMDNPVLSASSKAGVVYDTGGQSLFLFRGTEEVFDLSLEGDGDLLSARANDSGWLAVTAQRSGYKGAVTVYDASGSEVIQISLSSTFVVDAALSPDCKTVAVITMDQEGGTFLSQVLFFPVDQKEPKAQVSLGSVTVLDLDYEDGLLWVLGEDRVMTLSDDGKSANSYPFGRSYLKGCDFGGEGFALLLLGRYRAGSANQVMTIDPEGEVRSSMELRSQVLDFDSAGGYCSLLTGSRLTIYTPELVEYARLGDTQGARYTALSSNGSALLADDQLAWLYIPS